MPSRQVVDTVEPPRQGAPVGLAREGGFFCPQRGLHSGAGARLRRETDFLLQSRLRAFACVILFGEALALVRAALLAPAGVPGAALGGVIAAATLLALMRSRFDARILRTFELLLFGGLIAGLALDEYMILGQALQAGEIARYRQYVNRMPGVFVLAMLAHGMFVPNRWPRALALSGGAAVVAISTGLLVAARFEPPSARLPTEELVETFTFAGLLLAIGLLLAVYGAHRIHGYRRELAERDEAGMYRLERRLGAGGMGEVWLAQHQMLRRPVAIKMIRPDLDRGGTESEIETLRERFRREARATARLESGNTVHLFDFGYAQDGTFFYVMEYLDGLDLDQMVKQYGPLPAARAIYMLRQAALSLREAHERGLVHRDIKPSNLHVGQKAGSWDWVRVLDFGLVKLTDEEEGAAEITRADSTTGTPAYFPPELVEGAGAATPRSDIYALGAVAYWMVTGQLVFPDRLPLQMMLAHAKEEPVPPSRRAEIEIPVELEELILAMLRKEPADRPASMDALIAGLDACEPEDPWTPDKAADWWRLHHPEQVARAIPTGPDSGSGGRRQTRGRS